MSVTGPRSEIGLPGTDNVIEAAKLIVRFGLRDEVNYKDKNGSNILLYVTEYYDHPKLIDLIEYLIASGVGIKEKDKFGWTALHNVCRYYPHTNLIDIVRLLIEKGADVNAKNNDNRRTALHFVCRYYPHDNLIDIVRLLIEKGADVNAKTTKGNSPIQLLQFNEKISNPTPFIDLLVEHGAAI